MDFLHTLNQQLFFSIYNLAGHSLILDKLMIFGADYLVFVIAALSILSIFSKDIQHKKVFLLILISLAVGFVLLKLVEMFIYIPRPFLSNHVDTLIPRLADDDSFPSDHSLILAIITWSHLFFRTKFAGVFILALIWTGFARVFVGVHYPLDILGGVILGLLAVTISWQIQKLVSNKLKNLI